MTPAQNWRTVRDLVCALDAETRPIPPGAPGMADDVLDLVCGVLREKARRRAPAGLPADPEADARVEARLREIDGPMRSAPILPAEPPPVRIGGEPPSPEIGMIVRFHDGAGGITDMLVTDVAVGARAPAWPDVLGTTAPRCMDRVWAPWGGPVLWRRA